MNETSQPKAPHLLSSELLHSTPFDPQLNTNPYRGNHNTVTQAGQAPFRKLMPTANEALITEETVSAIAKQINTKLSLTDQGDNIWHSAEMTVRLFRKSLLKGSERTQAAMLTAAKIHSGITSDDVILELATGAGGALKMLLSGLASYSSDPVQMPKPTIISIDYAPTAQAMAAMRLGTMGQEAVLTKGLPELSAFPHQVVLARDDFDNITTYPDDSVKLIYSDNGIIYVKQKPGDDYDMLSQRLLTRLNFAYDKLQPGGRLAISFLNVGFARKATFLDLPNRERWEAIKQLLHPDYRQQFKLIMWAIKNGEALRAELLELVPFTLDEVVEIFQQSKFGAAETYFNVLAGMINICVAQKKA